MIPKVSIICPTMRVGGLNFLFDSLARQTYTNFELVLVDGIKNRRAERVAKEAHDRFLRVVHVEPSPNSFPLTAFCAYSNAGIVAASGELALFIVDYSILPLGLVAAHVAAHEADKTGRLGVMGAHRYCRLNFNPAFESFAPGDIDRYERFINNGMLDAFMWSTGDADITCAAAPHIVDGGAVAQPDADPKLRLVPGPASPDMYHAKNESVRLEHCIAINGYDEDLDGSHGWQDTDFAERLSAKAGVQWRIGEIPAIDIANPRARFPFGGRTRPFKDNERIWQQKKAAGYHTPNKWNLRDKQRQNVFKVSTSEDILTVAMIYGEFSSAIHGPFDIQGLYTRVGLTGSESSFFNLARTLAERGHRVVVFCVCDAPVEHESGFVAMPIRALPALKTMPDVDAILAWNEPDYLEHAPPGALRIVDQQLNDWGYCHRNPVEMSDIIVFPSQSSLKNHGPQLATKFKAAVIPNSVDITFFSEPVPQRNPHRVIYCSSPDRGLHHLLSFWPEIRARVSDAELKIFYRLEPWLARARDNQDEVGRRARYIETALARLSVGYGVDVVGPVPNAQMARELQSAAVLAYPCDPVRYTEGFGCSVLDATAAGCVPIISDADALEEVHGKASLTIKHRPGCDEDNRAAWVSAIVRQLKEKTEYTSGEEHAEMHSRERITSQWESLIRSNTKL